MDLSCPRKFVVKEGISGKMVESNDKIKGNSKASAAELLEDAEVDKNGVGLIRDLVLLVSIVWAWKKY